MGSDNWLKKCVSNPDDDGRCKAIQVGRTTSAVLSMLGCLFALFVIVIYKKFRFFTQRLVTNILLVCFLLAAISLDTSNIGETTGCSVAGFFRNFFGLTQNLWIMCIEVHLLILAVTQTRYQYLERIYHGVVWSVGITVSVIPFFGDHYGPAGIWCWIKGGSHYENTLRVLCYYAWLLLLVFGGGGIYAYIIYRIHRNVHSYEGTYTPAVEAKKEMYKKSVRPLLLYPFVGLLLGSVTTTNRLQNWINPGNPVFGLSLAHSIVSPLWGFVNAMLFLLNKDTLHQLKPSTFLATVKNWGKTTFTMTKSVDNERDGKVKEYTLNVDIQQRSTEREPSTEDME